MRIAPNPRAVVSRRRAVSLASLVAAVVACATLAGCGGEATSDASTDGPRVGGSDAVTTTTPTTPDASTVGASTTLAPAVGDGAVATSTTITETSVPASTTMPRAGAGAGVATTTTAAARTGTPRLEVSQTSGLDPAGVRVTVRGVGYDPAKGVYVGVCTQAAPSASASTCIGGVDMGGDSPSLAWVSSNPPPYAVGLTQPYEPGGTFVVSILVVARSGDIDCRVLRCGIITRNDHLRYSDRSQDVFVPISFGG